MDNYSYSSYAGSGDSSPRSREIDCENPSWDEPPNYKVKFMCSYGGKIQPRTHDNQLAYVAGDTKILAVDRTIRFSGLISKLSSLCDAEVCFKYQLPGEDLDALISVTNDEDLEHMMLEYDRLHRASTKPARLRLFLFPLNPPTPTSFASNDSKTDREWFVDALNSVPIQSIDASSPPASKQTNPDFLFGLDKGSGQLPTAKLQESIPESTVSEVSHSEIPAREDRREPIVSPAEIHIQMQQELQRLQIANQELERRSDENLARTFTGEYYMQKVPEKTAPAPSPLPSAVSLPASFWQERHMTSGGYLPHPVSGAGNEQPVYLIQAPAGMYQTPTLRPAGQVGQGYYAMQRTVPDVYREQPVYSMGPPQQSQPPKMGGMAYAEGVGIGRPPGGVAMDGGFAQVAYDSTGRQVYYSAPVGVVPQYQNVNATSVDVRQSGTFNPEGKVTKPSQGFM